MLADYLHSLSPSEILAILKWTPAILLGAGLAYKLHVIRYLLR